MRFIYLIVFGSTFAAALTGNYYVNCKCQNPGSAADADKTSLCCRLLQALGVQGTEDKYPGPNNQCLAVGPAPISGDDFSECCGYYNLAAYCW